MTASLTLLGLGLKLRSRWKKPICCGGRPLDFGEDEVVVVVDSFEVRVWDSSSIVVEGFMELVVLMLLVADNADVPCSC